MTYLSDKQIAARWGIAARSTVWSLVKRDPSFPRPVKLSPGMSRWRLDELEAWEARKAEAR